MIVPDLVTRLRTADTSATSIFKEAADEIERLRTLGGHWNDRASYVAKRCRDIAQNGAHYVTFDTEDEKKASEAILCLRKQATTANEDAYRYSRELAQAQCKITRLEDDVRLRDEVNATLHKKLQDERYANAAVAATAAGATELQKRLEMARCENETLKREFARVRNACDSHYVTADGLKKRLDEARGDLRFLYKIADTGVDNRCGRSKDDDFERAVGTILNLHKYRALERGVVITAQRLRDLAKRGELQYRSPGGYFDNEAVRDAEGAILQLRIDRDRDHSLIESFLGTVKNVWSAGEKK